MLTKVALVKNMLSQLSKTESEVILSFPKHFLFSLKNTSFLCTKLCINSQEKIFISQFLKSDAIWHSNDFGDQKVSNEPLKPHICGTVTNILHTHTISFLRYMVFSKPCFFTFWPKSQHRSTFVD